MRLRLRLLLPLVVAGVVAVGFVVAAGLVGDAVRGALTTVPGLTVDRAVEAAVRVVGIVGVVVTVAALVVSAAIARIIVSPLNRLRAAAERPADGDVGAAQDSPIAEIQDVARGMSRVADELRERHDREAGARSELAGLVEAVSEGIVQLDGEGRVARTNSAARELLGLPPDAVGRPVGGLFRNMELRGLLEDGVAGRGTDAAEVVIDDRRILVSVRHRDGGGAVATFVDLTDLRRLEEVRRDFVANASHELKTPLTSIRGYSDTLIEGGLSESEQQQFLATISRNAARLQRIVDDLLDLSRLEAGRWEPELEPVKVLAVAESSWLPFADRAADQGVAFSATSDTDARARADRRALEQVFANLYDNALRYTDGGGRIRVTVRSEETAPVDDSSGPEAGGRRTGDTPGPGPWVVAEVTDTGAGIPRDALPRIFERFYRVDPARSRAEGGTGLGLSIVRHMLESMGGGVDASSALGKGTTIRFWLPAVD